MSYGRKSGARGCMYTRRNVTFRKDVCHFSSLLHFLFCLSFFGFHLYSPPFFDSISPCHLTSFLVPSPFLPFFYLFFSISFLHFFPSLSLSLSLSPSFPTNKTHRARAPRRLSFTNMVMAIGQRKSEHHTHEPAISNGTKNYACVPSLYPYILPITIPIPDPIDPVESLHRTGKFSLSRETATCQ